jgi:hypothetical protein
MQGNGKSAGARTFRSVLADLDDAFALAPRPTRIELGRAQKTVFLARYLRSRGLQREINDGLNVIESWNRANSIIFYGKNSWSIADVARMSGVAARTLRHYDDIGLLEPAYVGTNG